MGDNKLKPPTDELDALLDGKINYCEFDHFFVWNLSLIPMAFTQPL